MHRWLLPLLLVCAVRGADAQVAAHATAPADTLFAHAQRLVSEGQGAAGRALVDSLLAVAPAGSERYAEALFWRAALAADAASAERDYRRLSVEFPLSPRSADALMRLAQMELARGDDALALRHLERLNLEYPNSPARGRAGYWMARAYFDQGDAPRACDALRTARASAAPADVELQNQLDYSMTRCAGVGPVRDSAVAVSSGTGTPTPPSASSGTPTAPPRPSSGSPPTAPPAANVPPASRQPLAASRSFFAVQVAATASAAEARALVRKLAARKLDAWIDSSASTLHRVRVGHYATRAEATRQAERLKQRGMKQAFVVAGGGGS
jgi:cell division septation protein DedD